MRSPAAVFNVPKARYFSSIGSQTIISPSRMMLLGQRGFAPHHSLADVILDDPSEILRQTALPNVRAIEVRLGQ